jgi:hypothetical protein
MRIRKYDHDYSRRVFMEKVALGLGGGVLAPLWPTIVKSAEKISKAYPDEMTSIEMNTKGKIKVGDTIDSKNVEHVKHLLDEITYVQVSQQGRKLIIAPPTTDVSTMYPYTFFQATLKNAGKAKFDATGNVVEAATGDPWIGGTPFPDMKTAEEAVANITLSWGRHDLSQYAIRDFDINPNGSRAYQYDFLWTELNTTARTEGARYFQGKKDMLRYQSVFFTAPQEQAGASFLCPWYYDQRKLPELYGYLPQFRRVRQFPANQRFEPLVPGITLFLSDAWGAGDPMLTWGNTKLIGREPHLVSCKGNWKGKEHPNWENTHFHGGPKGLTFMDTVVELAPECLVVESQPTGYPRAPVGKKRMWIDARNGMLSGYITYDRRDKVWKQVDAAFGQQVQGDVINKDKYGYPVWSVAHVHIGDVQSGRMSLLQFVKEIRGGYKARYEVKDEAEEVAAFDTFLTQNALNRLGTV